MTPAEWSLLLTLGCVGVGCLWAAFYTPEAPAPPPDPHRCPCDRCGEGWRRTVLAIHDGIDGHAPPPAARAEGAGNGRQN